MDKNVLDRLAKKLMFEMNDSEYDTLSKEFEITLKQMDYIGKMVDIDKVKPMFYPFDMDLDDSSLRDDISDNEISFNDMKVNIKEYEGSKIKVPKVVE